MNPGDTIIADTLDASCGRINSREDLPSKSAKWPHTNPCVGPIYVEGAEPGDALCVKIEEIKPRIDWAASWIRQNLGALAGSVLTPSINPFLEEEVWIYKFEGDKVIFQANHSDYTAEMPYEPSLGTIGTSPLWESVHTLSPGAHGGNMDCIETAPGTTVFLPVNVPGALLSFGDAHGIQGDGELTGTAVEMRSTTTVTVDVLKNFKITWPRIESDDYIMVVGSARPLEDAYRVAHKELVMILVNEYGLFLSDAYKLLEHLGKARIGNVVSPAYCIVAKFPKKFLPKAIL
ncbi:acetamidase/formamidase family protein [Chloroflexota bacterium]